MDDDDQPMAAANGGGHDQQPAASTTTHSEQEVQAWRAAQIDARQQELARIVDSHDDHVRELFHLDRFVTLVGFDPVTAKQDKSDVFLTFQHNFDLWTHAAPEASGSGQGRRATRRAATDRKGVLAPTAPVERTASPPPVRTGHPHGKVDKGKGKAVEVEDVKEEEGDAATPAAAGGKRGKKRKSLPTALGSPADTTPSTGRGNGKPTKRHSLATSTLSESTAKRQKTSHPTAFPLASTSSTIWSHHLQVPPKPTHGGSLSTLLSSYLDIEDDLTLDPFSPLTPATLDTRAERAAVILERVAALRAEGRTLDNPDRKPSNEAKRDAKDHQDNLLEHMAYFSKLVSEERKAHVALAKKVGKMVLNHFAGLTGAEERKLKEEEAHRKALAKWAARMVRQKWKLAVNVVKAKRKERLKLERDRIGKQQLNAMLDKSTTMLQAQQVEMVGGDSDSDSEDESSDESADESEEDEEEEPEAQSEQDESEDSPIVTEDDSNPEPALPNGHSYLPRARSALSTSVSIPPSEDGSNPDQQEEDGEDEVFAPPEEDATRLEEDEKLEAEMEEDEEDSDAELGGLEEDAKLSIEELMKKAYGGGESEELEQERDGDDTEEEEDTEMTDAVPTPSGLQVSQSEAEVSTTLLAPRSTSMESTPALPLTNGSSLPSDTLLPPSENQPLTNGASDEEEEVSAMSEFGSNSDVEEKVEEEDNELDAAMSEEEGGSDESEMDGLAEEAEMSIEDLMKKYGYGAQEEKENVVQTGAEGEEEVEEEVAGTEAETEGEENGDSEVADESMAVDAASPSEEADGEEEDESEGEEEEASAEEDEAGDLDESEDKGPLDRPSVRPPFLLRGSLRPYQQAGLEWLASLYANGVNGILADEMGLGKTIQTISLLAHLACDKGQWGPHLVVVPTSVMLNWEMEFKKFLPGFKILTYYGTQKERKERRRGWNAENAFHVCVTSYQIVLADQHMFRRKPWQYMILDEAHHIKNFRSQRWQTLLGFNARHRLLLTGTPLQNNLMELWSLLYFLMPHGLMQDGKGPFADHADFQSWFSNPMERAIENGEVMDEETKATVNKLHTVLRPYLLRRLKAEVETQMPGKTESIIYCRLSKRQRFLYDDFMSRSQTRETLGSGHFLSIINCLMQLRKVCNHPDLFEVRPIVTSFAMSRSVPNDYEPVELLVRKRLLDDEPIKQIDWSTLTLLKPEIEATSSSIAAGSRVRLDAASKMASLHQVPADIDLSVEPPKDTKSIVGWKTYETWRRHREATSRVNSMAKINTRRCTSAVPFFGHELLLRLQSPSTKTTALLPVDVPRDPRSSFESSTILPRLVLSNVARYSATDEIVSHFGFVTPKVRAAEMARHALPGLSLVQIQAMEEQASVEILQRASVKLSMAFPDRSLLQYDCGKLQKLDELLRECKAGGHRALIFTQMTKVLDILEIFLSFHGHRYLRLDGSTKIEERQVITERFNSNDKILCFISSTRSGGLGINLQGADTVIFYDSDWNPALDRQCQDRAHRIGQTREVRIWRFVTEHSIEENMLKKANQKRRLDEMVISDGDFTTDYLQKLDWRDYLDDSQLQELGVDNAEDNPAPETAADIRQALAAAEDEEDAAAAKAAEGELTVDQSDFVEGAPGASTPTLGNGGGDESETPAAVQTELVEVEEVEVDPLAGTIDGYIVSFVDSHWELFA